MSAASVPCLQPPFAETCVIPSSSTDAVGLAVDVNGVLRQLLLPSRESSDARYKGNYVLLY